MHRRQFLASAAAASGVAALAACAPGTGSSDAPSGPAAEEVDTDVAGLGDLTLRVWDQEVRGSQDEAITALIEAFEKKYPNVTVDRVKQSFDDLQKQTALTLSGGDVPDVLQVNNARADMGEFVKAGQLLDLSGYADAYGWTDRFPESVLSKARYSTDAKTFGDGSLWGVPQTGEVCGIFYSQQKLEDIGAEPPTSWDELTTLLETAQKADELPVMLGNLDKWPALHVFGPLQADSVDPGTITELAMGNPGADWTSEENVAALTELADWAEKKYLGDSPNGLDYDTAWADFTKGKGVLLIGGSWLGTDMEKSMGEDLHFMAPPAGSGGKVATTGGTGLPFSIPAKAKNQVAAAAYIDFLTSDRAMELIAENGGMPVLDTADLAPDKGVNKEIFEAFDTVSTKGVLLPYLDYATPTFSDTAGATLQELIGGQSTPEDAAAALQKDYADFTGAS
jgi:raffinose/stachyose/melibiose transport system substrate-binding protein